MTSMFKQHQNKLKKVQLAEGVFVYTPLADVCIPALRSGYAGYPVNPRWNAIKFHAWKIGHQWREALERGEMIIRSTDSMLVPIQKTEESTDSPLPRSWGVNPILRLSNPSTQKDILALT